MSVSTTDYKVSIAASKNLVLAFKEAARVIATRTFKAVLGYIKVSVSGDDMTLEATDLELYYRRTVFIPDLGVAEPFSTMVPRKAVTGLKNGVVLSLAPTGFSIGGIEYTPEVSVKEFPAFPALVDDMKTVTLESGYFADLTACAVAASRSELRPVLAGVCHRGDTVVATDARRLCSARQSAEWTHEVVIPAGYTSILQKAFGESGAYMGYDPYWTRYKGNGYEIMVRAVAGAYPDVTRIIPKSFSMQFAIRDTTPWVEALDMASTVHKQTGKDHRDANSEIALNIDAAGVVLSARGDQRYSTNLEIFEFNGDALTIRCSAQYLKDALSQIGNGALVQFNGAKQPFLLTSAPDKLYRRTALVSPILIK